jgi:hypothetical protein
MAMLGVNGGLIGVRRVPALDAATGIWTFNEQVLAKRAAIWPSANIFIYRYFRLASFASTSLNTDTIDFGEIELYNNDTKHTGVTCTSSFTFTSGAASALVDGITGTSTRAYREGWSGIRSGATISFDLGSAKTLTLPVVESALDEMLFGGGSLNVKLLGGASDSKKRTSKS